MIKLAWQYSQPGIKNFVLYRKEGADRIHVLETLPGTAREFYDKALKPATHYTYYILANFNDWKQSEMSDGVKVNY